VQAVYGGESLSLNCVFTCITFALWVSICSAAPEIIWEGFNVMSGRFGKVQIYSIIFIAALLVFFVEPIIERIRRGSWKLEDQNARNLLYTAIISLIFGIAAVCIEETMNAYLSSEYIAAVADHDKEAKLIRAIEQVREWASIPFIVIVAWFIASTRRWIAFYVAALTCVVIIVIGVSYGWEWRVIITAAIPSCVINVIGCMFVSRHWNNKTFPALAGLTASVAGCWFILAGLVLGCARLFGISDFYLYTWTGFFEDFRFFFGWALGLAIAPNPMAAGTSVR
jgi:hypothetical protein